MNSASEKSILLAGKGDRTSPWKDPRGDPSSNATFPLVVEKNGSGNNGRLEFLESLVRTLLAKVEEMERRSLAFPSVVTTPDVCGGSPRLIRTRIPIWVLQHMRQLGFSESKILESYPTLTAGDLAQAWGYVAAHNEQIAKEIEENERY